MVRNNRFIEYLDKNYNCTLTFQEKDDGTHLTMVDCELDIYYHWIVKDGKLINLDIGQTINNL